MCGIVGIVGNQNVAGQLYDGLTVLQHRGQDAAGIATADGTRLRVQKANGLVRDVFDEKKMAVLEGRVGIAHCRYPTAGSEGMDEAQPFYVNSPYGIALAHNGNLINTEALRQQVFEADRRNINTDSDSEVLLNVFAYELDAQRMLTPEAAIRAVAGVHRRCKGGYAVVSVVLGLGLVAFRDPHGIRPLVLGKREHAEGTEYIVSSESAALDILGYQRMRDVRPGEALVITARGELFSEVCAAPTNNAPCIFEYVYFARPDSMIDNISVHKARMRMGLKLGEKILRLRPDHDIDTIIPIPDTSRDVALEMSNVLGVKYREGFVKNRYVGRTFIMPG
ncbi:amidophosphoribosyltransferase, partial [Xanthomonas perforans]